MAATQFGLRGHIPLAEVYEAYASYLLLTPPQDETANVGLVLIQTSPGAHQTLQTQIMIAYCGRNIQTENLFETCMFRRAYWKRAGSNVWKHKYVVGTSGSEFDVSVQPCHFSKMRSQFVQIIGDFA